MAKSDDLVLMAVIGAPHGVRGELRAKTHTGDPLALGHYGPLRDQAGRTFKVLSVRPARNVVVLRIEGVNNRENAEALKGVNLYVQRSALPDDSLEQDEFFHADMEGLAVRDANGVDYGVVDGVYNFGAGDVLELKKPGSRPVMIPFSEIAVPHIDWESGILIVDPMAAGLVGEDDEKRPGSRRRRPFKKPAQTAGKEGS